MLSSGFSAVQKVAKRALEWSLHMILVLIVLLVRVDVIGAGCNTGSKMTFVELGGHTKIKYPKDSYLTSGVWLSYPASLGSPPRQFSLIIDQDPVNPFPDFSVRPGVP
jgi:hypothetical protein